jgi:hypothetical protein
MKIAGLGRFWQFVGVAIASHAATRHVMLWQYPDRSFSSEGNPEAVQSWIHLFIGMAAAMVVFWTGTYVESAPRRRFGMLLARLIEEPNISS